MLSPIINLEMAKRRNQEAGLFYFSPETIRFFRAQFHRDKRLPDGSLLIVESTKRIGFGFPDGRREYRVLRVLITGETRHYPEGDELHGKVFRTASQAATSLIAKCQEFALNGKIEGER